MSRRARITWLLDSPDPWGRAVMAVRRMTALDDAYTTAAFALSAATVPTPRSAPLRRVTSARTLAAEARIARSDVIVTTSYRTIDVAVPRLTPGTRLVHFLHSQPDDALGALRFMRAVPHVSMVVVPLSVDRLDFARRAGLPAGAVQVADDFVLEDESLLGSARSRVAVAAGHLGTNTNVADVVDGFAAAVADLPGWQLRVLGGGSGRPALAERVEDLGLSERVFVLGPVHDAAAHYLDAGVVIRVEPGDVNGLSVYEGLAAGVPVLGSRAVPAVARHVRHGQNGWVLDRTDPIEIADGLRAVAAPDLRATLAQGARREPAGLLDAAGRATLHGLFRRVLDAPARHQGGP